ncbi:group III truncated hemoglobin [Viridibacterium curvum]|uniref:Globin n=1 Tax=Viridibacterium curvum TaxID=1101404 RepID=A0ABP9QQP0_9RHOO
MHDVASELGLPRVAEVVARFYAAVRVHPALAAPFARVGDWPAHEAVLTHFWWVTLGGKRYMDYRYRVAEKHIESGFTPALLEDWLALFADTVRESLPPELAEPWLARARHIGESLRQLHAFHAESALSAVRA